MVSMKKQGDKKMTNTTNQPTHNVYQVIEGNDDQKSIWNKIGVAWEHQSQKGLNVHMDSMPLTGKIVLLKNETDEDSK